ncbi:MAG: transglycosylase domain-containing protein, partial [Chthoniobacterales bacterium]|nr:transglycosylase domain-containing protein [Chthoniobacterales bacterium]
MAFACFLLYALVGVIYYLMALRYNLAELHQMPQRTVVYDANGQIIGRYSGENRIVIPYNEIPESFIKALLAREDARFYRHLGVDPIGIARAALRNLIAGGIRQGGSTITQQLARNSFPLGGRNYHRKLLEAALSFRIETELSKEEILESYVNRIYFGSGCYGLQTASLTYFDKPARNLTLAEAALLAGLIRSPTRLSPFNDPEASLRARNSVIARMLELGWISPAEAQEASSSPLLLSSNPPVSTADGWAMDTVRRELEPILDQLGIEDAGLNIYTTLDLPLQTTAESALANHLLQIENRQGYPYLNSHEPLQGAVFIIDNRNGAVRAVVGSRDYSTSKFNRAYFAQRQAGSVVKPFLLAQALAAGLSPTDRISDARLSPSEVPRKFGPYDPSNADGRYFGPRPVEDIVIYSRNTMAVRAGFRAGLENFIRLLQRAGIADQLPNYPSIFLGAFETNLRSLVSAI